VVVVVVVGQGAKLSAVVPVDTHAPLAPLMAAKKA